MKIVSLLPSATEIVCALGLENQLVAVTHECDYPPEATLKPIITSSALDHSEISSSHIHEGITGLVHAGKSIYHLDEVLLKELKPDLILTQELCEVCAVSYNIVVDAAKILEGESEIISLEPNRLRDIFANIALVGERAYRKEAATKLVAAFETRLDFITNQTTHISDRPGVYCMEWLVPPFAAGHWVPEMVALAGGSELCGREGQVSQQLDWQVVVDAAPEIVVLMPCGFNVHRAFEELDQLENLPGWQDLPAVQSKQVFAVDGSSYFNRPGPRVVTGVEILAQIIHPETFEFIFAADVCRRVY